MLDNPQKTVVGTTASSSVLNELVAGLASSILQAPVAADQTLVAQGLDSLGAVDLLEALEGNGYHADYELILGGATVSSLAASLRRAAPDGPQPAPAEQAAGPVPLIGPQSVWVGLERRGWGAWANVSLCLSMPASVISAGLLPAIAQSLCDANDAMRLVLVDSPDTGEVLQRATPGFQLPIRFAAAPASERDAMRLIEEFEGEETSPFAPSTRALILASADRDGRHWLCITMHHAFTDRISMQSLARQVRTMISRGEFRAPPPAPIGYIDHAIWQGGARAAADPREAERELRMLLAGADVSLSRPVPRLADADVLDLGERPPSASSLRPADCDALEALAAGLDTTLPLLLHALFSVLATRLTGDEKAGSGEVDMLLCHVVSNRERGAYLKSLVGCLDTSIPVAVRLREGETLGSLCLRTRQAFADAHRAASVLPRGQWMADGGSAAGPDCAAGLFERVPHINIVRAGGADPAEGDLADIREHPVRRAQKTRWGLLLRVALPPQDGGSPPAAGSDEREGMRITAYAEHRPLATVAEYGLVALLRDLLGQPAERVGELLVLDCVDRAVGRAAFATAQLRRAAALAPRSTGGQAFIYDKLVARQRCWYEHDERYALRRDDCNRFVGTAENPFPFTQLDKLLERRYLEALGVPLPSLLHVLPRDGLREALTSLAPSLPGSFVIKPVGAGHSFGVTLVCDGRDLTRNGTPFDAVVVAEELSQMAERGYCRHEGHVFPFNFSSFLIEELVEDECGFAAATDYKFFHIGETLLWIQIHFRDGGHGWVAFVDAAFNLLPQPAWDPTTCWRTHEVLVCTDQAMVEARRPACLARMLEQSRRLAGQMGIFVRLDWYADRARGPLMGEITLFPHMLQPRSFYSSWANGVVADAWRDPDGVAVLRAEGEGAADHVARIEAILSRDEPGAVCLEDFLPPASQAVWAFGDDVSFEALRAYIADFDLTPWAVAAGDRVALLVGNGVQLAALLLATMNRYVAVPIGSAVPVEMLLAHLREGEARTLLVVAGTEEARKAREAAGQMSDLVVVEMMRSGSTALAALPPRPVFRAVPAATAKRGLADDVLILRTSGSTGAPKSVCFTLAGLVRSGALIGSSLQLGSADIGIAMLPLHHVGGIACNLVAPMLAGGPMRFFKAFDPKAFFDALAGGQGASWCYLVPTMWDMVLDYAGTHAELRQSRPWPRLRVLRSAGADLPHDTARALAELFGGAVSIVPTYGMTEAMPIAAPPLPYRLEHPGSVGRVLPTVDVEIVDASATGQMSPVAHGIVGEITVSGPTVARRIDAAGAASVDDVTPRGYFRTGDLGRFAADGSGWLFISGRIKDAINRGGETIAPGEVEAMLRGYPGWREAGEAVRLMAFARKHRDLGEDVALAVAPLSARVDLADLNVWADRHLPPAMQPKTLVLLPRLPVSDSGKLQRARFAARIDAAVTLGELGVLQTYVIDSDGAVARLEQEVRPAQVAAKSRAGEAAVTLASVIEIVRGLAPGGVDVGADSRLDDVGINSLGAVELSARLNERFGSRLPVWAASDHPTPRALYGQLVGTAVADRPDDVPGAPSATRAAAPREAVPSPATTAARPLQVLFLHGEGADSDLMELSLLATQWMGRLESRMEFVFLDAPHLCAPKPEFHAAAVEAGLYGKAEYRSWGAATEAGLAESVAAVLARLDELAPVDAIGGICDGGLVAALVASRRPDIRLYLNISSSPLSRFPDAVAEGDWRISCPSVHLISARDEFHTLQEQLGIPQRCEKALLLQHDRGHAVPTLDERLKCEMLTVLEGIAGPAAEPHPAPNSRSGPVAQAAVPDEAAWTVARKDAADTSSLAGRQPPSDEPEPPVRFSVETLSGIEALIAGHESVESVAVLDLPDPEADGRRLHAFVVLDQYAAALPSNLRESLQSRLPAHWMPERFIPVDALPRTAEGGLDHGALIERLPRSSRTPAPPRTPLERVLAAIWQAVLMMDVEPGIDDDFFDLGGYSLLSLVLIRETEARLGRPLPRRALMHLGTIRRMATILEEVDDPDAPEAVPPAGAAGDGTPGLDHDILDGLLGHLAGWRGARSRPDSLLFGKNTDGSATPIFWCFQGYAEFSELARFLGPDQPLYGMRSGHLVMENTPQNVDALAACYVSEMLEIRGDGPFIVGGHCQAARIAFQIARGLQDRGKPVSLLCLQEQTVPMAYPGRVALFLAERSLVSPPHYFDDADRSWQPFYDGPVSVNAIAGDDGRFFKQPNIKPLAAMIRAEAERAMSADGGDARPMKGFPRTVLAAHQRRAAIRAPGRLQAPDGQSVARIEVEVTNSSDAAWPCSASDGIAVGYWLYAEGVEPPVFYGLGARLPVDLAPGARVSVFLDVAIPRKPGLYRIDVDLVDNRTAWFRHGGSAVAAIDLDTRPGIPSVPPARQGLLARLFGRTRQASGRP